MAKQAQTELMNTSNWSKPHYGVQHLAVTKPRQFQVTVADYDSFAVLQVVSLWNSPLTTGCDETVHATSAVARHEGERKAAHLGIVKV